MVKVMKSIVSFSFSKTIRSIVALISIVALLSSTFLVGAMTDSKESSNAKKLTEEQKIIHVLNRLGYGARPGDVEKVKAIGIEKYIEQQLNPEKINDSATEAKLKNLSALNMQTAELFEKYPNPGALLNMLQRRNQLPQNVSDANKARQDKSQNKTEPQDKNKSEMQNQQPQNPGGMTEDQQRQARETIQKYLADNGLKNPREMVAELYASRVLRAVYSERQLNEVMVDFWTNHFNVFVGKNAMPWYLISYDRDTIRPNALGKFKDLLIATAKSPAMLVYLDNFESVSPNAQMPVARNNNGNNRLRQIFQNNQQNPQQQPQRMRRGINENYARELMELHTLGVDGGYTQKDVQEVARCFTGWTVADARGYRKAAARELMGREDNNNRLARAMGIDGDYDSGTFVFASRMHDNGEKTVLGQKIPSGGGMNDGMKVIDILVKHPSTAKFIAKKLAIKFVNDNPSKELIERVANAFTKSDGDIRTTLKAIFTSKEFFAAENYRAKIKTPLELAISAIRALDGNTNGGPGINGMLAKMGEQLYGWQPPTGYPDQAEDWVNTGALLERLNFGLALASNRIPGTRVDLSRIQSGTSVDREKVLNQSIALILDNEISSNTKAVLMKQIDQPLPEQKTSFNDMPRMENMAGGQDRAGRLGGQVRLLPPSGNPEVVKIVGLVLGSPEFQRQ
jgi:uncharacterized protein (DUF1800 family)